MSSRLPALTAREVIKLLDEKDLLKFVRAVVTLFFVMLMGDVRLYQFTKNVTSVEGF